MQEPRLDDLIELARSQSDSEDPIDQLRAAASLKAGLDDLTDALLGHFVDQARRAGATWSQIGEALGVTKQAAQQRHTSVESTFKRLVGWVRGFGGVSVGSRFTSRARAVVVAAEREAVALRHGYIGTEHLLLALFAEPEGIGARVLAEHGVDRDGLVAALLELVPEGNAPVEGHVPFTPRAREALEQALRAALELGHNYIGTEHVLLGLFEVPKGLAAALLTERGVTEAAARTSIVRLLTTGS